MFTFLKEPVSIFGSRKAQHNSAEILLNWTKEFIRAVHTSDGVHAPSMLSHYRVYLIKFRNIIHPNLKGFGPLGFNPLGNMSWNLVLVAILYYEPMTTAN